MSDWQGDAIAREGFGAAAHARGDLPTPIDHYGQSLALNRHHGRQRGVARLLCSWATPLADIGQLDEAVASFRSSAQGAEEISDIFT